jgi:hypothetical protein
LVSGVIGVSPLGQLDRALCPAELVGPFACVVGGLRELGKTLVGGDVDRARGDENMPNVAGAALAGLVAGDDGNGDDVADLEVERGEVEVEGAFDAAGVAAQAQ